jgi:putrescine importer
MSAPNQGIAEAASVGESTVGLQRSLGLWSRVIIGMVMVQPTAPMGIYSIVSNKAHGHVASTILAAMIAMLFAATRYGRMARVHPSAGSAYTDAGQEMLIFHAAYFTWIDRQVHDHL